MFTDSCLPVLERWESRFNADNSKILEFVFQTRFHIGQADLEPAIAKDGLEPCSSDLHLLSAG